MDEASATTPQEQDVQAIKQRPSADRFGCCPFRTFPHASGGEGTGVGGISPFGRTRPWPLGCVLRTGWRLGSPLFVTLSSLEPWNFRFIDGSGGRAKLGFVSRLLGTFLTSQKNELHDWMSA